MIRRGFWLMLGAAGGIMGYRRATSLGRRLSSTLGTGQARAAAPGTARRHWARETIRFTRDVREGMDLYLSRRSPGAGPTLEPEPRRSPAPPSAEARHGNRGGQGLPSQVSGAPRRRPSSRRTNDQNVNVKETY